MAQALSNDRRLYVLKASASGMSAQQAAARFGVGISTTIRWIARAKDGEPTSCPQGWRRPSALDSHETFVVQLIEERKDIALDEMVKRLSIERQLRINRSALGAWLRGRGWTFKKVRTCTGARPAGCPEASARLARWLARPRSGQAHLHRRNRPFEEDGTSARALENNDLHRNVAPHRNDRTVCLRWRHER